MPPAPTGKMLLPMMALLAVAYAVAALLAQTLAFAPNYASAVWPAAGVALAGLLIGGSRLWPGICAGYLVFFLVQFGAGASADAVGFAAQALVLSAASTMQALLGAWLVRPLFHRLALGQERVVWSCLLLGGPLACLVAPTLGVAMWWWFGRISSDAVAANWLTWWVGDSIGVVVFCPLALLAAPRLRRLWQARVRFVAAPLLAAATVLVLSTWWFNNQEEATTRSRLAEKLALSYQLMLQRSDAAEQVAVATASFIASSAFLAPQEFAGFAASMRQPGLLSLQWLPRVRSDKPVLAGASQPDEFPVQFAFPPQSQLGEARVDVAANLAVAEALTQARDGARPVASAPMQLRSGSATAVLVVVPVYGYGIDAQVLTLAQRRDALTGFVLAVLDPMALSAGTREMMLQQNAAVVISDVTPGGALPMRLAQSGTVEPDARELLRQDFAFAGRTWRLQAYPSGVYWRAGQSTAARMFLLASLAAMLLSAFYVLASAGRTRAIEREVAMRTAQIERGQRRLELAMELAQMVEWEYDPATGAFTLNDRYFGFLHTTAQAEGGYTMDAMHWARTFVHPDDQHLVARTLQDAQTRDLGVPDAVRDIRLVCRDGYVRDVHIFIEFERDAQGRLARTYGTIQDVTDRRRTEDALRRSEQYNRSIVESSVDCVMVLSLDGAVLDMTPQGRALMGVRDFEQVHNQDWLSFWQRADDRTQYQQALVTARAGGTARFQGHSPTFDGTPKWWDVVVTPILGEGGRPVRLLCMSRDITTEREATQEIVRINAGLERAVQQRTAELSEREALLRATFDAAPVGISHITTDWRILRVNPKQCEITGYTEAQLVGSSSPQLTHPQDKQQDQALVAEMLAGERSHYTIEKRYVRQDGTTIWVRVHGSVVRDATGKILYRVAISEDISEARQATEMRIASEHRYRDLFEFNPMPMWTYDNETLAFTDVNLAALHHYGYSRDEFLAMTIAEIRPVSELARLQQNIANRGEDNRNGGEFVHRRKNGELLTVEITSYGIDIGNRPGRLVLANDISVRKRTDGLLAAQKAVLERIASGAPLADTLDALARIVDADSVGKSCSILLLDRASGRLHHGAAPHLPAAYTQAIDGGSIGPVAGSCGTAAFSGQVVLVEDIATDPLWANYKELALAHGLRSCWSLPIRDAQGGVLGTFAIYDRQVGGPNDTERQLIETLSHTAAIAISKHQEKQALRESEERFRAIYEKSPIGIVLVSADGTIQAANPHQCALTGYSAEELVGKRIQDLTHLDDVQRDIDQLDSVWGGDRDTYSIEKRAIRKDGSIYWVSISGAIVRDDANTPRYGIRVIQDMTGRVQADQAQRESEQRFRSTFELAVLGIAHVGGEGRYQRVNPSMSRITGYDEHELLAMGPLDLIVPEDRELDAAPHRRLLAGDIASYSVEMRCRHKGGALVWTNATVSAVRDGQGSIAYTFVILEDISRRKLAEAALQHQQELNRLLLENLSEGVVACDGDGKLILFNKAAREWHGTDIRSTPPEQWASHYDLFEADGRTPLVLERIPLMRAFNGETVNSAEMCIARHGHAARFVLASGAPLYDSQGIKRGAVVVMHDVTERQRNLRELKCIHDLNEATRGLADPGDIAAVTTRLLGSYLDVAHCAYADVDGDGEHVDVLCDFAPRGPSVAGRYRLSGIGADLARALRDGEVVALDDMAARLPAGDGVLLRASGMRSVMLLPLRKGDALRAIMAVGDTGTRRWTEHDKVLVQTITERCWANVERERAQHALEAAAADLKAANATVEHERASLARRVAERTQELTVANTSLAKALDAAEAASRAKSAFLATISHEIRTPMNGVLGAMELLERTGLYGERGTLLGTAQESARSLLGLLNDLLDMAKIEAGRIEIALAPASLRGIVDQVVATHRPNALTKGISLGCDVDASAPPWVRVDALRVCQILGNLVSNAVKFTSRGGVSLTVRAVPLHDGRTRVRFVVRDSGVGIPDHALQTLFKPFEQGTAELARQSGGTGLGLAISRGLAERMGGAVWLESHCGLGTTATLELALETAEAAASPEHGDAHGEDDNLLISRFRNPMADTDAGSSEGDAGPRVLVVDDHPVNRRLLQRQLAQLHIAADVACDGVEALERLQAGRYALVITDCEMPRLDGFALVRAIRASDDAALAGLPVLACTAHALPEVERRCRESGMDDVLIKPIALVDLARSLRGVWPQHGVQLPPQGQQAPAPVASSVLDRARLAESACGDADLERELLEDFVVDMQANVAALRQALAAGAYDQCKTLAHRSRGGARIVGAVTMAHVLTELERLAEAHAPAAELGRILAQLDHTLDAIVREQGQTGALELSPQAGASSEINS